MSGIKSSNKRVFVSSTVYDLIDIRSEIETLLREFSLTPVMSDSRDNGFDSTIQGNSIETCLVNLKTCEQVILVLSQRYGPSLKSSGFTDHSATHLEYIEAKNHGIPIHFYVRDQLMADYSVWKKTKDKESLCFSWTNKDQFDLFKLIDERKSLNGGFVNWISTFSNSIELKQQIKRDLKIWADSVTFWDDVENNKIPILFPHHECIQNGNFPQWKFEQIIKNCGTVAAKNIAITIQSTDERREEIIVPSGEAVKLISLIDSSLPVDFDDKIKVEYEDLKGRKYEDLFVSTIRCSLLGIRASFTLQSRKFLDQNGQERIQN
ncbi:MAG: DUF4062 domain-containing protein [Methylobacter tundripaludum]|nr:DUF4062 domain-containing protein [Methylobacter tundripaludum]